MAKISFVDQVLDWGIANEYGTRKSKKRSKYPDASDVEDAIFKDLCLPHQQAFINDVTTPILGMSGGFGCGKTRMNVGKSVLLAIANPGCMGFVMEPVESQVRDILVEEFEKRLPEWGFKEGVSFKIQLAPRTNVILQFNGFKSVLKLRSFENWNRIRGPNAAFAVIDEFDTIERMEIAEKAWNMIQARVRVGQLNQICVGSTPEGFKMMYKTFVEEPAQSEEMRAERRIIYARTDDNIFNKPDYAAGLRRRYPANLIEAYLNGQFTNLAGKNVYPDFDQSPARLNDTDRVIRFPSRQQIKGKWVDDPGDYLYIGMDFNVGKMAGIVFVKDGQWPSAVAEIVGVRDTLEMIKNLKARYPDQHERGRITIYPDASGGSQSTNASKSDIELFREAGFKVDAPAANPPVRDRVLTFNVLICNGANERRCKINPKKCPSLYKSVTQQVYDEKTGAPDKKSDLDHPVDGAGYFLHREYSFLAGRAGTGTGFRLG